MIFRAAFWWSAALSLMLLAGCLYPVQEQIDADVCRLAQLSGDHEPLPESEPAVPPSAAPSSPAPPPTLVPPESPVSPVVYQTGAPGSAGPENAPHSSGPRGETELGPSPSRPGMPLPAPQPLQIPPELMPLGSQAIQPLRLPRPARGNEAEIRQALEKMYQPLPPLIADPVPQPGPQGRPLTLTDLQHLALASSPLIIQARANVEAMRGAAIQAGLPPNPNVGYEGDTMGTTGGAGYQGGWFEQLIKTANKLQLARASATMNLRNAELALRRAEMDLRTSIRRNYFAILVARENMRVSRALVGITTEVYNIQVRLAGQPGLAAPFEPMYLRVLANQTRFGLLRAQTNYVNAWKQLTANMGTPDLKLTELAGRINMPVPIFRYKNVLERVLARHTDVMTAYTSWQQARFDLRLAQVTPIPDFDLRFLLQKDYTGPPNAITPSLVVGMPLPLWNRNQGGIMQAQGVVRQMSEEPHRVRNALTSRLAEAFALYSYNLYVLKTYREQLLPDQIRVYQGIYERYRIGESGQAPAMGATAAPAFNDVIVAQQNLAGTIASYITALGDTWEAVVSVTDLIQTEDMFQISKELAEMDGESPAPDVAQVAPLPCCHPCSSAPPQALKGADGTWPQLTPAQLNKPLANQTMPPARPQPTGPTPRAAPERQRPQGAGDDKPPPQEASQLLQPPPPVPRLPENLETSSQSPR